MSSFRIVHISAFKLHCSISSMFSFPFLYLRFSRLLLASSFLFPLIIFFTLTEWQKISCSLPAKKVSVYNPSTLPRRYQNVLQRNRWCWLYWAYHLHRKSTIRFYLHIVFDLMGVACANNCIVYNMMHPNDFALLDFKIIVSTYLIGRYTSRSRAPPYDKKGSKRKYQYQLEQDNLPSNLQEFENIQWRCEYCYKERINLKTYVKCTECGIFLCLIEEWNCFKKHHS